ncbi:MAG: DUF4214 domain-containing protein, partial [Candidatus Omnitrophica bacterium]|nr:DUF4214 domain-containing protein [Candidatus Omnitrophota bacterium]
PTSGSCNPTTSIIGTPTISGTYTFTLTVTSGSQSVSNQFTLIVDSADTIPTTCSNNATNPPTCSINNNGYCINNATNPPSCTSCPHSFVRVAGSCVVNVCANGTINPPACTLTSTQQTANYTAWLNDIYQNYLGRATDPVGLNFYLPRLLSLSTETEDKITAEKNQIKIEIAGSQEAGYYTFLKGVYWTELGREFTNNNDADGLKFYIDQLLAGKSKEQVQAEIHASPEAVQYRAAHTIVVPASTEQTVWLTNVYQVYLGRTPDTAGLNYYLDLLNSGAKTQDQVKAEIVVSKEATQYIFLKNVYQTELGRDFTNDANGLAYYMNRLLSATNLQQEQLQIKAEIHASSEAVLYRAANVLGVETFHFTQFLDEGTSGNEVRELQKFLNTAGYNAGNVDGVFGAKVKEALIKFQIANGLKADGFVGYEVRTFLNR